MQAVANRIGVFALMAMTGLVGIAAQTPAKTDGAKKLDIMLMKPATAKSGDNAFEVMVKDAAGKPVTKADVSLVFVMPKTATMAEMRNTVKLKDMGNGMYAGQGSVMMAGNWNVSIDVMQNGKTVGEKKITLTAK